MKPIANPAPINPEVEARLTELEVKLSYSEDLLEQLNLTIYRQQLQIDALQTQVAQLRLMQAAAPSGGGEARDPRDELPPHY